VDELEARVRMVMECLLGEARRESRMCEPMLPLPWWKLVGSYMGSAGNRRPTPTMAMFTDLDMVAEACLD
jgi:hypothetical protein